MATMSQWDYDYAESGYGLESKHSGGTAMELVPKRKRRRIAKSTISKIIQCADDECVKLGLAGEDKYKYFTYSAAVAADAGMAGGISDPATEDCLNGIANGTAIDERQGKTVRMQSLLVDGQLTTDGGNVTSWPIQPIVTIWLVCDYQTNGAQADSINVLYNPTAGAPGILVCPHAFTNPLDEENFKVLWKKTIVFPAAIGAVGATKIDFATQPRVVPFKIYVPLHDQKVVYKGAGDNVTDIVDNSLHLIAFTNVAASVVMAYNGRLTYRG